MTEFFGPGSPYLQHPLLTRERSAAEIDRVLAMAGGDTRNVLDVGCGFGRHSIELARRGFDVVGVDPSATLLDEARARAFDEGLAVEFVEQPGQRFDRPDSFDLAICLFTTLGQIALGQETDDAATLVAQIAASLRPGGTLVVEVPDRTRTASTLVTHESLGTTTVSRRFDDTTSTVHECFTTPSNTFELSYRLYDRKELCELIEGFGLVIVEVFDDGLVTPPHNFMTVVARNEQSKESP